MAQKVKPGLQKLRAGLKTGGTGGAAPAPTPAAAVGNTGGYYSPRQYGTQKDSYAARAEAARAAMEEHSKLLRERQRALEESRAEVERKQKRYYDLREQLSGDGADELLAGIEQEWTDAVGAYGQQKTAYDQACQSYSPYESAYNRAAQEYNDYIRSEQEAYGQWKATIRGAEDIRAEQQELGAKRAELKRLMQVNNSLNAMGQPGQPGNSFTATDKGAQIAANEARIRELQEYLGAQGDREKLLAEELEWSEHFLYEDLRQNGDFAQGSRYQDWGDALNNQVNTRSGAFDQEMFRDDAFAGIYWYMDQTEVDLHNYIRNTQGAEAARAYLGHLTPELNRRRTEGIVEDARAWTAKNPANAVLASAGSALVSPIAGFSAAMGQVVTKLRGGEIDPNDSSAVFSNVKNAVRDEVGTQIETALGETWGPVGSFAYGVGMSMADMVADAMTGNPYAAMAAIGSRSFSESVIDAKNRGLSDDEAMRLGAASMAAELITERLGIDEMLKLPKGMEDAGFWRGALKGAVGEAGEEGLTNLINLAADISIAGDKSEFAKSIEQYKDSGMSDADALNAALKDAGISLALDTLGGALSGGAFGGYRGAQGKKAAQNQKKAEAAAAKTETVDKGVVAPDNVTSAPDNVTSTPDNVTSTTANGTKETVAGGAGDGAPAVPDSRVAEQSGGEKVSRSLEELKQAAVNNRNPAVTGVLRTAQQEDELRRIEKATTKTEVTAIDHGVSQEKLEEAMRVKELIGKEIVFEGDGRKQGFWGFYDPEADEIHLAADTEDIMAATVGHELTHSIERTREWENLRKLIQRHMAESGESWAELRRKRQELYAAAGHAADNELEIDQEAVAYYVEKHLLTDETSIRKLVRDDRSIARRILDWLDDMWAKVAKTKGSKEREFVRKAREIYRAALAEAEGKRNRRDMRQAAQGAYADGDEQTGDAIVDTLVGDNPEGWLEHNFDEEDPGGDRDIPFSVRGSRNEDLKAGGVVREDAEPMGEHEILTDGATVTAGDGVKYSIRSMKEDIAEGQMFTDLQQHCGWTQQQTDELKRKLTALVEYMTPHREILDMNETYGREGRKFSPYKPNSDPLYKISMDFSTLCSKRLLTQYVIENLQLREQRPMTAEEQMAIRDMLNEYRKQEKGIQVACAMCYVEAARLKAPGQITRWMEDPESHLRDYFAKKNPEFNARVKKAQGDFKESRGYDRNAPKKEMKNRDATELNRIGPRLRQEYQPSEAEQEIIRRAKALPKGTYLSAGNLADLSEREPEIYAAYTTFVRNATRAKALETDEPYYYGDSRRDNGNGIVVTDSFIENVNRENGMRFSSWSDWRIQHMLDYITAVIDNSVRGAAMHGYTKFPEEVRVLGNTGMMLNMSGVAGTQTGLNPDGSLSFSETESIDAEEAVELRERFPETAGLQCIGVSDAHIIALLDSEIIDYVIPYHASGLNASMRRMADIYGWKDYTGTQHATVDKGAKLAEAADPEHWHEEPSFSEFFVGYDTGMTGQEAMEESARRYVQMCRDRGLRPKFEKFAGEPGYWKLLIDRKMINQKTGELIRQQPVKAEFDFDEIRAVVDRHVANYDSNLEARALKHVADNWDSIPQRIRDLKKAGKGTKAGKTRKALDTLANETLAAMQKGEGVKYSVREVDSEGRELSEDQKRFFADSKMRNPNGKLKVMYHGTDNAGFTRFMANYSKDLRSFFFTDRLTNAASYSGTMETVAPAKGETLERKPGNMACYLDIKNPLYIETDGDVWDAIWWEPSDPAEADELDSFTWDTRSLAKYAEDKGYDGVIIESLYDYGGEMDVDYEASTVAIVFKPEQIKSVNNTAPTADPDIRYSIREEVSDRDEVEALLNRADREADSGKVRREWKPIERAEVRGKASDYLRGTERKLLANVAAALDVPRQASREFLQPIVQELADEYLKKGTISPEVRDRLFETAWEKGLVVDEEFYDTYKEVKDHLRTTAVTLSETDRDSRDWEEFRKRAFGTLRIVNEGGTPVDVLWKELQEMAPALFPDDILNPEDQLRHMYEVGKSIRKVEKTLNEHYGSGAGYARQMTRNDFDAAIAGSIRELWKVQRYAAEQKADQTAVADEDGEELTEEEITALYPKLKEARKAVEKAMAKNLLSKRDKDMVQRLLRHDIQPEHLDPETDDVQGILAVYEAKKAFEEVAEPIRRWNKQRKARLCAEAEELVYAAEMAGGIEDKAVGILYSRETMERNIRDIVKDKASAGRIIDTYFKPVHEAEAAATRMKNEFRQRVKALDISRKVRKGDTVSEAYAVQFYGEVSDILRMMEESKFRLKKRDGKTYNEWKAELQKLWEENPSLEKGKIELAAREMGEIYEELYAAMNKTRVANGYEPINHRSGYFPHFQQDGRDGILGLFGKAMGIDVEVQALPTTINGLTHTFKPGIRWFGNALERKGFDTAYDAVEGFDRYIEGVASVVHQTPNIQRLRALANQIRYRTSDEGLREQIRKIQDRTDLTDEQKDALIRETASEGKFQLSNFVVELDEYTNLLANKKSRADRDMEQAMGREMYNIVKGLESRVAANMVAINPGSWLTNFIPITQGWACLDTRHLLGGMMETIKAIRTDDGMVDRSAFLTNRQGSDPLVRTAAQEWSARLSSPMELIDNITAGSLVRARYAQNLRQGMSEAEAMSEADEWVAGVMADRSKGAMPTLFHRSNPLTKVFTQFQLEVNNQLGYMLKDIPREKRKKGAAALALALLKLAIGAWLYNQAYEWLLGRRPALDPIDMAFGFGKDVMDPELDLYDATVNLGGKIAENTPFIGGLVGGGRVPISSALPDWANLGKALLNDEWSAGKKVAAASKEMAKPLAYMVLPFGGGQVKKVWEAIQMIRKDGSYTVDSKGNLLLQYPLYSTNSAVQKALEAGQAMVFGKTTIRSGRAWVEGGFKNLSADQTATYQALVALGVEQAEAFELMQELRGAEKTDEQSRAQVQRDILRASGLEGDALGIVYYDLMVDDDSKEKALMDSLRENGADMGALANCLMDIKDAADSNAKRDILRTSGLTEGQKQAVYSDRISGSYDERIAEFRKAGMDIDDFLIAQNEYTSIKERYEDEGDMATAFARWVNNSRYTAAQKKVIRDSLKYWRQMPANADRYDRGIESGLSDQDAAELAEGLDALEPMEGKTSVADVQKWRVAIDQSINEANQLKMLQAVGLEDTSYEKVAKGYEMGVAPAAWVRVKEVQQQFDANGNGSMTQAEWKAAIDGICAYGIVLPGDNTRFNLTTEQKAVLWQMLVGKNTKSKNNPYSPEAGRRWRELMGYE